jgi:hypothetical protein
MDISGLQDLEGCFNTGKYWWEIEEIVIKYLVYKNRYKAWILQKKQC